MARQLPTDVLISPEQTPVPVFNTNQSGQAISTDQLQPTPIPAPGTVLKSDATTLIPTTTEAQDKTTEGQRHINLIWENTQSRIAVFVVGVGVIVNSVVVVSIIFFNKETSVTQLALISICLQFINLTTGIVIGFYFSRTNHSATGGVGPQPMDMYTGR